MFSCTENGFFLSEGLLNLLRAGFITVSWPLPSWPAPRSGAPHARDRDVSGYGPGAPIGDGGVGGGVGRQ